MTEQNALRLYNHLHTSLREHLIPVREFLRRVQIFEKPPVKNLRIDIISELIKADIDTITGWTIPYPYESPAWKVICKRKFPQYNPNRSMIKEFDDQDLQAMADIIQNRIAPNIANRISDELLAEVDDNYDYGAVVHRVSGKLTLFSYATYEHTEIVAIPIRMITLLTQLAGDHFDGTEEDKQHVLEYAAEHKDEMNVWYKMHLRNIDTRWSGFTDRAPLSIPETQTLISYLTSAFEEHAKVLLVP